MGCYCKHGGYYNCADKYTPGVLPKHKWEKCMSVDLLSWGYRRNMQIVELMDLPDIIEVGSDCDCLKLPYYYATRWSRFTIAM